MYIITTHPVDANVHCGIPNYEAQDVITVHVRSM